MEQYTRVKQAHPDAFLFFRLGDFYEMFFDDAVRGAALLGLTLTSRNKQEPNPIPMCGLPWHQRDAYVARLLRLGHKVAVCDQLEDAAQAKGLVQRGVTEVLTPGSVTGDSFLEPSANNFLAALWPAQDALGMCLVDVSTAEVKLAETPWEEAAGLLSRVRIAEWIVPLSRDLAPEISGRLESVLRGLPGTLSPVGIESFDPHRGSIDRWSESRSLFDAMPGARAAAAAALGYLDRMQGGAALPRPRIERWSDLESLRYDAATARHLEIFQPQPGGDSSHTLWHHLNLCATAPGARRLRAWIERPLADPRAVAARHDKVAAWLDPAGSRPAFREALRGLPDLERLTARLACGRATPRDLGAVRDALERLPAIASVLASGHAARAALAVPPALRDLLRRALTADPPPISRDGDVIRAGFDALRDELHALAHSGKRWVAELETSERARTGIPSLKVGFNRVFGYYLEVTRTHLDKVPGDYERRQTLTAAERFVTPSLKVRESEILSAEERLKAREHDLFVGLRDRAATHSLALLAAADALAALDAESTLAEAASRYEWVRPELDDGDRISFRALRHAVVERLLPRGEFVPNDVTISGRDRQILLLTGPNMGGKSTYLRQIALAVLLAQAGSFVPAAEARIGRVDRLFTRVGAADRLGSGQSTFMVEMTETADILRSATARSLVLLDEIGRGTSTYDGLALAWAVTEFLHASDGPRPRTLFATHYHELTQLAGRLARLANVQVAVREKGDRVVFLHRIAEGAADRSYGIHVAQLAGLPPRVIERAKEVLGELETERTPERLERARKPSTARDHSQAAPTERPDANRSQIGLFETAPHPIERELREIAIETLTPLEALNRIAEWKRRGGG
ncbi:MAG: DNA mismatch repair protein MutS [Candidatus Eisenbacteria bacterium]|nr:DNA mismatch repair protein MutS [Candidatus Eisenbacteria bacterium]